MTEREIPEEVRRAALDDVVQMLLDDAADSSGVVPSGKEAYWRARAEHSTRAARALTGEYKVEVMREIAKRILDVRSEGSIFTAMDAIKHLELWANELEASIQKGGADGVS